MWIKKAIEEYEYDDNKVVNAFGVYHPYHGGNNPNFDGFSSEILKVKNMDGGIMIEAYHALNEWFDADGFSIVTVPSHDPAKRSSGIKIIASLLCSDGKRIDATDCLVRKVKINKAAHGGNRNVLIHKNSIELQRPELIIGKDILLLDDVTTTNNSLIACMDILLKAGAQNVFPFALAQTAPIQQS